MNPDFRDVGYGEFPTSTAAACRVYRLTIIRICVFMRGMYICMCNAVTDRDIRRAVADGVRTFAELQQRTRCSTTCGCCMSEARACFQDALRAEQAKPAAVPLGLPVFAAA